MKSLSITILALILLTFNMSSKAEPTPTQTTCPVMIGNPIDPSLYVDHEGQRIYFCCKMCVSMFSENPQEYLVNLNETLESEHVSHDHDTDHQTTEEKKLITFIGKFHPVAVHLPIALFLVAALAELLFLFTGAPLLRSAARFNLLIAVPTAVISVLLGLAAANGTDYPQDYAQVLNLHKILGFISLGLGVATLVSSELLSKDAWQPAAKIYRTALFISVITIGATGHFGGLLVYGLNHFSW